MKFTLFALLAVLSMSDSVLCQDNDRPQSFQTVAEASRYTATSTSAEVTRFIKQIADSSELVRYRSIGKTTFGKDIWCVTVSQSAWEPGDDTGGKNVVLLLGNIHSGECAGKEALLQMVRELAAGEYRRWLEKNILLFVPNYSADANDQMGPDNRPGQIGPDRMGRRANPQGLDLNRDFVKLEAPETRALVGLIDAANPHLFVDCHTTNGSKHRYGLTYDIPHNPAAAPSVSAWLRESMMPTITKRLDAKGLSTFYYGNFNDEHDQWISYGHQPRYSTEYVGLRGRLAILSEAYSYSTYRQRIEATHQFVAATLDYVTENSDLVSRLLDNAEKEFLSQAADTPQRIQVSLSAAPRAFERTFQLKGFKDDQPHDYACQYVGDYHSLTATSLPWAWVIPATELRVVDRLLKHGVALERVRTDEKVPIELDRIANLTRATTTFQKHRNLRIETNRELSEVVIPAGSYLVRSAQPLGRLAAYLLEAESDDGFVAWNFFHQSIAKGSNYPVLRLPKQSSLETEKISKITDKLPIQLDMIDGPTSLFANQPKVPKWFGKTNLLADKKWGRPVVVNCETNAVVVQETPFETSKFEQSLRALNLDDGDRQQLLKSLPTASTNGKAAIFSNGDHTVVFLIGENHSIAIGDEDNPAELLRFNPAETQVAFVNREGLNFLDLDSRAITTVKKINQHNLVGKLDWVYQEELYGRGNFKGFWWHPSEKRVAFLSLDEEPVIPFTVMDHLPVGGRAERTNYPKAGGPLPRVKLGVVDTDRPEAVTWVKLDQYGDERLISAVSWSRTGDRLVAQIQNRQQTWLDVVTTDPHGNDPTAIFRDETEAWVESPGDPAFIDDNTFLWVSPRNGYRHLYRYRLDGTMEKQLTDGEWEIRRFIGLDHEKKNCFFTSAKDLPTEMHLYRLTLDSGQIERLTTRPGYHEIRFSDDKQYYLATFSDLLTMPQTKLHRGDGETIRELAASSDDRFDFLQMEPPKLFEIPTEDQPMDAMLLLPPDFDETKKYPLLVYTYSGPQAPRVKNRFAGQWYLWHQMLAQNGLPVLIVDPRSCSHRSARQAWPIFRRFASQELEDILAAVEHVVEQGWVDKERIGLWGWSYGGYMTAYAMTRSDVFCAGISGAPVTDWKNYDAIYTERYMGLPQDNQEGYRESSVLERAEDLSGKLLLIHGTIDDNVHLNNTMQFVERLQDAGKQFELMLYPANRHSVQKPRQLQHLRKLMTDFLVDNLQNK